MQASGFGRLDAATGGFERGSACLLYGPRGSGKTAFCLSFLHQGLSAGEHVALVTAGRPSHLLEMANFFGWNLSRYLRAKQLTLLEYPDEIEDIAGAAEPSLAIAELRQLLGTGPVDRLVFDPVTPLVEAGGVLPQDRLRAVIEPLAGMAGVTLVVVNGERSERVLGSAKDMVDCVLRFAPANQPGGPRYLRVEKHRRRPAAEGLYRFVLEPDNGFIDAAEAETMDTHPADPPRVASIKRVARTAESPEIVTWRGTAPSPRPAMPPTVTNTTAVAVRPRMPLPLVAESEGRLLLIEPDGKWRSALRQELQRSFIVVEACGAADAAQVFSSAAPDAIVLSLELDGESGIELVSRLRQNGWNLPIITTCRARTNADHLAALAAGADHCLSQPIDGRILRLTVFNSLCRLRNARPEAPALPAPETARPATVLVSAEAPCTDDLNVLYSRLQREISHGRQHGVPFVLLTMRTTESSTVTDLACSARTLLRATDVLLIGARGIACLLAELPSADGFLDSFAAVWSGPVPQLKRMRYEGQEQFLDAACSFLADEVGATVESAWLASAAAAGSGGRASGVAHG